MPETFIIYREKYRHTLAEEWRRKFYALSDENFSEAKRIIEQNMFTPEVIDLAGCEVREVLKYYCLDRE